MNFEVGDTVYLDWGPDGPFNGEFVIGSISESKDRDMVYAHPEDQPKFGFDVNDLTLVTKRGAAQ